MCSLLRTKKEFKNLCKQKNTNYIYRNGLDKACFQHDTIYGRYKDLTKRIESDKFLRDKAFKIASNPKYDGYKTGLASVVYTIFDKKSACSGIKSNQINVKSTICR